MCDLPINAVQEEPKKKMGRPKGSKNKNKGYVEEEIKFGGQ